MAQIGSCLLEDATFCLQDGWSKQDESSTLKRKEHGTDGIVLARGLHDCPRNAWGKQDGSSTMRRLDTAH